MDAPPDGLDQEDVRRWKNQRRRRGRRQNRRRKWLALVREQEPDEADRIEALRQHNPQAFRKALVAASRRLGFFDWVNRATDRDLEPLDVRRAKWNDDDDDV